MDDGHRFCNEAVVTAPSLLTSDPANLQEANGYTLIAGTSFLSARHEIFAYLRAS